MSSNFGKRTTEYRRTLVTEGGATVLLCVDESALGWMLKYLPPEDEVTKTLVKAAAYMKQENDEAVEEETQFTAEDDT